MICSSGTFSNLITNICEKCHSSCETCNVVNGECLSCSESFFLDESKCRLSCSKGKFANYTTNTCDKCDQSCLNCYEPVANLNECVTYYYLSIGTTI